MRVVNTLVRTERETIYRNVPWTVHGWRCLVCNQWWEDRYWCNQSTYPHDHVHMVSEVCPFQYNKPIKGKYVVDVDLDF